MNFAERSGSIRPLHGVNNGPASFMGIPDVMASYRQLGIPCARLHDVAMTNPGVADIPCVFPLFHAAADEPRNFLFGPTDDYIGAIVAGGTEIVYRLGASIDHSPRKFYSHPPADNDQWTRICLGIIAHCNEGWADGFHRGIRYWEIWNEPDIGPTMWTGTPEQYFALYTTAARAIKSRYPALKIGGPSVAHATGEFARRFLAHCLQNGVPLDFFSWHCYHQRPAAVAEQARAVRALLDERRFTSAESHINEWHFFDHDWARIRTDAEYARTTFEQINGIAGAVFAAGVLVALQDTPVEMANYYSGDTHRWGLFDRYGCPHKTYHVFRAFRRLLDTPNRVAVRLPADDLLTACAGISADGDRAQMLLCYAGAGQRTFPVQLTGFGAGTMTTHVLDAAHDLEPATASPGDWPATVHCEGPSVLLMQFLK